METRKICAASSLTALGLALFFLTVWTPSLFLGPTRSVVHATSLGRTRTFDRKIQIVNQSGHRLDIHWIHPKTGNLSKSNTTPILDGVTFKLNSFENHKFEVRELPNSKTGECGGAGSQDKICRTGYFSVNENDDQVFYIRSGLKINQTDNKSIARDQAINLLSVCQREALDSVRTAPPMAVFDELVECVKSSVASSIEEANEEVTFQSKVRSNMGDLLENYTCADDSLNTTKEVDSRYWDDHKGKIFPVKVMLERPASKIHVIENFISDEECQAVEEAAKPILQRATVADGKGGSELSRHRKAMQAGIKVPWRKEERGDPIARLSRRVYDYTNYVLGLAIEEFGQEDLMSIQYFGRGEDEEEPDRYTPHCDGDCAGKPHRTGNRVATMVMYCTLPKRGGSTNFKNANVHIVPNKGSATFFSYVNTHDFKMDAGFTTHSGCPVIEGEKKIVTQWVRLGVDTQNPWYSFDTLGLKKSENKI